MPQDTPTATAQVNARLPLPMAQQLWAEAAKLEWTPSQYARKAIEEKLARDAKPKTRKRSQGERQ